MRRVLSGKMYIVVVGLVAVLVMALVLPGCAPAAEEEEEEIETVKIGFLGAFSGAGAAWFVPGLTGLSIWADEINDAGGLEVGGKKYLVEVIKYDDEFVPSKSVMGAKKLVLEDGVKALIMCCGPGVAAIQPFINEQKMLLLTCTQYESGKDRPYTMGTGENSPFYSALGMQYVADYYPEVKRVAVLGQDEEVNNVHTAWTLAGCEANGLEVVYNKPFACDTVDFAPIISAVLATEPDLVSFPAAWPEFRLLLTEQLYLQGYEGMMESSEWEISDISAIVEPEYIEGNIAYMPSALDDPSLLASTLEYYEKWLARYGPGAPEDVQRASQSIDYMYMMEAMIWEHGVKLADSFDPTAVRDALLANPTCPHLFGEGAWWGEEIYGVNTCLGWKQMVSEVRGGKVVPQAYYSPSEWFHEGNNAELALKYLEEAHLLWWQR